VICSNLKLHSVIDHSVI